MRVHLTSLDTGEAEVREVAVGRSLAGTYIRRVELTRDDLAHPDCLMYLQHIIYPRMVQENRDNGL